MPMSFSGDGTITGLTAGGLPNATVTSGTLASSAIYLTAPAGAVCYVAQNTAPTGWLKANGAAVSRTTYSALFSAIGTTFGAGDGSTTFNLPDLRGEFPRGWDDGRGVDSGRAFGSAQAGAIESHVHTSGSYATGYVVAAGGAYGNYMQPSNTGATGGTETRPRNIALLAIIKF